MFEELRDMDYEIRRRQDWIDTLRAKAESMTVSLGEKVQTSMGDSLGDIMCKILILEEELNKMIDDYADLKSDVKNTIFKLENESWQDILCERYVEFMSWERIAKKHHSTVKAVQQKKKRAMKKLKSTISSENVH